ncbi:MAG: ORF6N domain-containing protein [Elusimicrobiota bacterium]
MIRYSSLSGLCRYRHNPEDFAFQLTDEELESLRFQIGTLETGRGKHRKYLPTVFTEQGVAMLSGVLHSHRAVLVNVAIMRTFVRLRETLANHKELARKLSALENKVANHDEHIRSLFDAIRELLSPPDAQKKQIGFVP